MNGRELLTEIRDSGKIVFELEKIVKERFSKFRSDIQKDDMKDGYTETFTAGSLFMIHALVMNEYERLCSERELGMVA
ncbi:hypothetical protein DS891_07125 [Pseudoalteromonas sp. JC28]|nr:hypothetical protein [Pseudoalteromonas sp. JC28]